MELTPELLLRAYCNGIFPMGDDASDEIRWYSPNPRCIFDLETFHPSKRLMRTYRHGGFEFRINSAWTEVLQHCAARESTWITAQIYDAYSQLNALGFAHSVEAYKDGQLAGGLYGVSVGGAFMGESMFHLVTDASKLALVYLVERLKERGFVLLDTQFMTDHLATFGATNISRDQYLERLNHALTLQCKFD